MKPVVVSNSTPLIALASIGRFSALRELFTQIHIPQAVLSEVAGDKRRRAGSREILAASWINTVQVENIASVDFLRTLVDQGEAESIVLSRELNANLLLIDDKDGRKIAESAGIPVSVQSDYCYAIIALMPTHSRLLLTSWFQKVSGLPRRSIGKLFN